jgi:predicted  nucleic acid-binding Zn-ribbon protein
MEELGTDIKSCPCGHVYHTRCINAWISQKRVCPQCKGDALPLIQLRFNLFELSREERKLSLDHQIGGIKNEISSVSLDIETELAEINVLEPQLAEARAEAAAYAQGVRSRELRKQALEAEYETVRFRQFDVEAKRKHLNEQLEAVRERLSKLHVDFNADSTSSRRPLQAKDVGKLVLFMQADIKKLKEMSSEAESLTGSLAHGRQKLTGINSRIREIADSSSGLSDLVKHSTKQLGTRIDGFVPIDSLGHKRRRDEERLREIENRKPNIVDQISPQRKDAHDSRDLGSLGTLVGLLSDNDDQESPRFSFTQPAANRPREFETKSRNTLEALFQNSNVIVLD